jgi:cytochrome c556
MVPDHFPEGSLEGKTEARPEIWTDWDRFVEIATSAQTAAGNLVVQANAGNGDGIQTEFRNLAGTCKTCHDSFREEH